MKKKIIITLIVALVIIADMIAMFYPTVSNYINGRHQTRASINYVNKVSALSEEQKQEILQAARIYNQDLLSKPDRFEFSKADEARYDKLLNIGDGVMGILVIDKINVKLPIYHGTDDATLQVGVGHLEGSSLPVGGKGTHAVLMGHRGLPSSLLLTNLDKMRKKDTFILYVMGQTLTYQVDQIRTVNPDELRALTIDPGKDYCTLVTCTPYGINTQRLLVRGHRIPNAPNTDWSSIYGDARRLDWLRVIMIAVIPILIASLIYIIVKYRKINRRGGIIK